MSLTVVEPATTVCVDHFENGPKSQFDNNNLHDNIINVPDDYNN